MSTNVFNFKPKTRSTEEMLSGPIDWQLALTMRDLYLVHPNVLKVPVPTGGLATMEGLTVKRTDLETIFKNDPAVDEIFIMMAVRAEDSMAITNGTIGRADYEKQFFTTVLVGIKAGKIVSTKAIDYCEPCPNKCPQF